MPASDPRVRRLLALAALALLGFALLYLLAVRTELGQRVDEAALTGGREVPEQAQEAADGLLRTVSVGTLLGATVLLSAVAWLRRRPALILLPAAIVGCSLLAAELLKLVILERPDLVADSKLVGNSYPSGHTTVFASLGIAAMLVAPPRLRGPTAVLAVLASAGAGVLVVTADWHRPSDPIGSYLLTLGVSAALLALLYSRRPGLATGEMPLPPRATPRTIARRIEAAGLFGAFAICFGALLLATFRYGPDVDWNRFHAAYLLALGAIVLSAGLMVTSLLRALGPPMARPALAVR